MGMSHTSKGRQAALADIARTLNSDQLPSFVKI